MATVIDCEVTPYKDGMRVYTMHVFSNGAAS